MRDMLWYCIIGALAAVGLLCVLWVLFGCLLPGEDRFQLVVLCDAAEEEMALRRLLWLRQMGMLRCGLFFSGRGLPAGYKNHLRRQYPDIRFYHPDLPGE